MAQRIFGHIEGYREGHMFADRRELAASGVHRPNQAGISGSGKEGADSIVLSGGYEDDRDDGDIVIYTGHGGRDQNTGQQVSDQLLTRGNQALAISCLEGYPVRVIRGSRLPSPFRPAFGYRYDGLYRVEHFWRETGRSGFTVWRFRLVKIDGKLLQIDSKIIDPSMEGATQRVESTIQRIVRDTALGRHVKQMYEYRCQICEIRLEGAPGPYAEAAHIKPVGTPHNGPDILGNLLCLCPNHHVLLDYGGIAIDDDLTVLGAPGILHVRADHPLREEYLRYHRVHWWKGI
jgi:putative restriction endonuclease